MQFHTGSYIEQAKTLLDEETEDGDHEEFNSRGYKVMIADSLIRLEQAKQLKRIADELGSISQLMARRR